MSYSQNSSQHSSHSSSQQQRQGAPASGARKTRKKICRFCSDFKLPIDYKEPRLLTPFNTERGKLIPRRVTGNCAFHQRKIQDAVKRARILALLPYTTVYQQ